jgi:hypothetical protein
VRFVGAAAVSAGLLLVPLASASIFGRPADIPLARAPTAVVVADATQDGTADLVVANAMAPPLTVFPGRQNGGFDKPFNIASGPIASSMAIGDFDNDGGDDLVTASGDDLTLYAGVDATLVRRATTRAHAPAALAAADLDSDGNLDLVAANRGQSLVAVFRGRGDGSFEPADEYPTGRPVAALLVTDLDGDEVPDVATAGSGVWVLYGNSDGTLGPARSEPGPGGVRALSGDDFDGDANVDLAMASGGNQVTVLRNTGAEDFVSGGTYRVGGTPVAVAAVDLDGDGSTDLATVNRGTNDVSILTGFGDGRFGQQTRVRVGRTPVGVAVEDLDGEGTYDLATANRGSRSLTVMLNGADAPQPTVCRVPTVARRTLPAARRLVTAANCRIARVRRKFSRRVPRGQVIAVSPLAGTRLPVGSAVTVLVSRGPRR